MYTIVLILHNLLRWIVLIVAIAAVVRSFMGWFRQRNWDGMDDRIGIALTSSMDLQFLLGLVLYFVLSPLTTSAFTSFGGAMANPDIRFFLVEHFPIMLVAIILAHIGRSRSRKAIEAVAKHRQAALFYGLSLLLVIVAIPWWRPLLRL